MFDSESETSMIDVTLKNFVNGNKQDEAIPDYGFNCKAASNLEEDRNESATTEIHIPR